MLKTILMNYMDVILICGFTFLAGIGVGAGVSEMIRGIDDEEDDKT